MHIAGRRFTVALLLSIAVHALFSAAPLLRSDARDAASAISINPQLNAQLNTQLVPLKPTAPTRTPTLQPAPQASVASAPIDTNNPAATDNKPANTTAQTDTTGTLNPPLENNAQTAATESVSTAVATVSTPIQTSQTPSISQTSSSSTSSPSTPPTTEFQFPRHIRIDYRMSMGVLTVGHTVQTWSSDGERYQVQSRSESSGLVELFKPHRFNYRSSGLVAGRRLQPEYFIADEQRGSRNSGSHIQFNWTASQIHISQPNTSHTINTLPLPPDSQDLISLIYQLALQPPTIGRLQQPYTLGRKIDVAHFDVRPPEVVHTPLGALHAIPVVQLRTPNTESIAIWLATEYHHLPIRIHFYNREGNLAGEQLVTSLQVSTP